MGVGCVSGAGKLLGFNCETRLTCKEVSQAATKVTPCPKSIPLSELIEIELDAKALPTPRTIAKNATASSPREDLFLFGVAVGSSSKRRISMATPFFCTSKVKQLLNNLVTRVIGNERFFGYKPNTKTAINQCFGIGNSGLLRPK